jgi:hypothetical protein
MGCVVLRCVLIGILLLKAQSRFLLSLNFRAVNCAYTKKGEEKSKRRS